MKIIENYTNEMRRRHLSPNTIRTYTDCFKLFVQFYKDEDIRYISDEKVKAFLLHMVDTRAISTSYQNQLINAIKYYKEKILHHPRKTYYIDRPRREEKLPVILSQDETRRIFAACTNLKHKCILLIIYSAGLRESEIINLKVTDIDYDRNLIIIQGAKGNKDRIVPLSVKTAQRLRDYTLQYNPSHYLFEGQPIRNKLPGIQYTASSIRQFLNKYALAAGITKNVYPHLLRHCYATHSFEHGVELAKLQDLLGHKTAKTTRRYARMSASMVAGVYTPDQDL